MHRRGYLAFAAVMLLVQLGNERAPSRLSSPPNALAREPGQVLARLVNQGKRLGSSGAGRSGAVVSHPARSCHIRSSRPLALRLPRGSAPASGLALLVSEADLASGGLATRPVFTGV